MARPREFQREEVLDKAVEVFWVRGFEATSVSDLQRAMGIGRQSLYATFGDKQQVFAESLQRYVATHLDGRIAGPLGGEDGLRAIHDFVRTGVRELSATHPRRACLVFNTCVELAPTCRALGMGASLTTTHRIYEAEIAERLGVPDEYSVVALIPIGYPKGKFGPVTRIPAAKLTHYDSWGNPTPPG